MYGLLKGCCSCLTPAQRGEWQAHHCGVCAGLGRGFGPAARLFTNYDAALVSLLHEAQLPMSQQPERAITRCPLPMCRSRAVPDTASPGSRFARDVALLSAWAKLEDAVADGDEPWAHIPGVASAIRAKATRACCEMETLGFESGHITKAVLRHPAIEDSDEPLDSRLTPVEGCYSKVFEHTGLLTGRLDNTTALRQLGAAYGRLTYLCDAATDLDRDRTRQRHNLLTDCFGYRGGIVQFSEVAHRAWEQLSEALHGLRLNRHRELLDALMMKGLRRKVQGGIKVSIQPADSQPHSGREKARPYRPYGSSGSDCDDSCWTTYCCCECCNCCPYLCCEICPHGCTGAECCCCCCPT